MEGEKIFITGGAGYLGRNLIKRLYKDNEIVVYSRDESKHYYLQKEYPKVRFVIGDIRDRDLLIRKSKGCTIGIFAASLKQIDACNCNYEEASKIIIDGAINSKIAAEENGFKAACFISSDKSRAATTIYGAMKYVAGESFIAGQTHPLYISTRFTSVIYGNVMNSTGSIIPLIWESIKVGRVLPLYNKEMTRFLMDIDDAVGLILESFKYDRCNVIPKLQSFKIADLFEIYKEKFGLEFVEQCPRPGEKIHEIMAASEEVRRMEYVKESNLYLLHPKKEKNEVYFEKNEYSSRDNVLEYSQLDEYLKSKNYFMS
jgi:UDP-glucose 4-epimerase